MKNNTTAMAIIGFIVVMIISIPTILSVSTGYIAWHFLNLITFPIGKAITESASNLEE